MTLMAYGLMKTGTTESVAAGIVPKPELGLVADKVEELVMAQGQGLAANWVAQPWGGEAG